MYDSTNLSPGKILKDKKTLLNFNVSTLKNSPKKTFLTFVKNLDKVENTTKILTREVVNEDSSPLNSTTSILKNSPKKPLFDFELFYLEKKKQYLKENPDKDENSFVFRFVDWENCPKKQKKRFKKEEIEEWVKFKEERLKNFISGFFQEKLKDEKRKPEDQKLEKKIKKN